MSKENSCLIMNIVNHLQYKYMRDTYPSTKLYLYLLKIDTVVLSYALLWRTYTFQGPHILLIRCNSIQTMIFLYINTFSLINVFSSTRNVAAASSAADASTTVFLINLFLSVQPCLTSVNGLVSPVSEVLLLKSLYKLKTSGCNTGPSYKRVFCLYLPPTNAMPFPC